MHRRRFLGQAAVYLAAGGLLPLTGKAADSDDILLGGGRFRERADGPEKFVLARVIPARGTVQQAAASFFPHGLAMTGSAGKLAYVFEKIGPGAGLFDLDSMQLLETIPAAKNRLFYGHGVCSADGKLLYSTETAATGEGAIGVRETGSLRHVGDFPTYGSHPHDCHLVENGTVLAVTNGGGTRASGQRASICYIEAKSQRLLERIEMPDERFNAGHLFTFDRRESILVSAPRRGLNEDHLGAVSVRRSNRALEVLSQPADIVANMFGESLSVLAIPAAGLFAVTHPTPGMVTFWDWATGALRKRLDLPRARGLALARDRRSIWISHGTQAALVRVGLADLTAGPATNGTYLTGSHLFTL